MCLCVSVWEEVFKFAEGNATQIFCDVMLRAHSDFKVPSVKAVVLCELFFCFMSDLLFKNLYCRCKNDSHVDL